MMRYGLSGWDDWGMVGVEERIEDRKRVEVATRVGLNDLRID